MNSGCKKATLLILALSLLALLLLASCVTPNKERQREDAFEDAAEMSGECNTVVVYSQRQNSLGDFETYGFGALKRAVDSEGYFNVVSADGKPTSYIGKGKTFKPSGDVVNEKLIEQEKLDLAKEIADELDIEGGALDAQEPEVDLYGAVKKAARYFKSKKVPDGLPNVVVIIDSGISTKGAVDFRNFNILEFDPDDYIEKLKSVGEIGSDDLSSVDRIEWYCFNETAGKQDKIPGSPLPGKVKQFYEKLFKEAGVEEVVFEDEPTYADETDLPDNLPPVSSVNVTTVTFNDSSIKFVSGSDEFTSKDDASNILSGYLDILQGTDTQVIVTGFTDTKPYNGKGGNQGLSERRAERVKQELANLGIPAENITAIGKGESMTYPTDDENRRVEIELKSKE